VKSIEQEINDLAKDLVEREANLEADYRDLKTLGDLIHTGFLDTLKFAIEEGYLPDLLQRLGYGTEAAAKAKELADSVKTPKADQ
jgi:hypothetical protein